MAKTELIIGNWKMYKTAHEAKHFVEMLLPHIKETGRRVGLAVPFTAIYQAASAAEDSAILIGAQNMNNALEGAFTGEIAAPMIKEAGAVFVILGHSERRHIFQETDAMVNAKVLRALDEELTPILCIGEKEEEREANREEEVLGKQLEEGLKGVKASELSKVIIAYEPVWAIGTGKSATEKQAEETHQLIRSILSSLYTKTAAAKVMLLYGGSVKEHNAATLLKQKNINGLLVGGASLNPTTFAQIINS